ncbi:MAG: tRNA glutamyl-Q(34) synthetase GluQRS [Elusimicrobia bacterium]|nr:tRNA glutamyl-Q(34) synthetase GluQRS [Elusimicrobiota bacterium]
MGGSVRRVKTLQSPVVKTRLAPSPTGALHLGNARTFLVNWALARRRGWRILLRIEDLDGPRVKPEAAAGILETLRWLGLDWDEGPLVQSDDLEPYRAAIRRLAEEGRAFPCSLTRGQIEAAASAPQEGAHDVRYPRELRPRAWERRFEDAATNWRFLVPERPVAFVDAVYGPQSVSPAAIVGDFVVWTKRGVPAYQLAVVVDDHRQGVTEVVRGADLLDSAARQLLLYRALGLGPEPSYTHLPLVIGPDGSRLAKRHGDSRLDRYRALGVRPERVIGLLARWCGLEAGELSASEFREAFELARVPREPVVFTPEDDSALTRPGPPPRGTPPQAR